MQCGNWAYTRVYEIDLLEHPWIWLSLRNTDKMHLRQFPGPHLQVNLQESLVHIKHYLQFQLQWRTLIGFDFFNRRRLWIRIFGVLHSFRVCDFCVLSNPQLSVPAVVILHGSCSVFARGLFAVGGAMRTWRDGAGSPRFVALSETRRSGRRQLSGSLVIVAHGGKIWQGRLWRTILAGGATVLLVMSAGRSRWTSRDVYNFTRCHVTTCHAIFGRWAVSPVP